jgi:hypothetical protein
MMANINDFNPNWTTAEYQKWRSEMMSGNEMADKPLLQALDTMWAQNQSNRADDVIQKSMNYEFPQEELGRRMNVFGRQMTGMEQRQMQQFQQQFAGRTGGRMSSARGQAELGGQAALARAGGQAQIMQQAFNQELQVRQQALQAYIQKYGIDKQAQLAMEQMKMQQEQSEAALYGDIFGSLALLPFLL